MKFVFALILAFLGFCFVVAAVVSASVTVVQTVISNMGQFYVGVALPKLSILEQFLRMFLYAGELSFGTLLIALGLRRLKN